MKKTCIVIAGPTAVGKTAAAISVAKTLQCPIISTDSRQCYREMDIGVAKPSGQQLKEVPHYFVNSHSIHDTVNAAVYENYALQCADSIFNSHSTVVVTGGTGLYIKAFCEGLDEIPPIDEPVRKTVREGYEREGIEWLQEQIRNQDNDFWEQGEKENPHRLMRALEVKMSTGKSIFSFQHKEPRKRPFDIIKIGLTLPKEQLNLNIEKRVDAMIADGLPEEVKSLVAHRYIPALQTVGYTEFFQWMDGAISFDSAVQNIKTNTRRYAKRQLTWFRKDQSYQWFNPFDQDQLSEYILTGISK